jgi:hypothetical protein
LYYDSPKQGGIMIQSVGIETATNGTATSHGLSDRLEKKQPSDMPSRDQIEVRSLSDTFEDIDPSALKWEETAMKETLSMIRKGAGLGIHGALNPARAASLLADPGFAMA